MINFINTSSTYTHHEKNGIYKVLEITKSKHPDTGVWYPAVVYKSLEDNRVWVRSVDSFIENFDDLCELKKKLEKKV